MNTFWEVLAALAVFNIGQIAWWTYRARREAQKIDDSYLHYLDALNQIVEKVQDDPKSPQKPLKKASAAKKVSK